MRRLRKTVYNRLMFSPSRFTEKSYPKLKKIQSNPIIPTTEEPERLKRTPVKYSRAAIRKDTGNITLANKDDLELLSLPKIKPKYKVFLPRISQKTKDIKTAVLRYFDKCQKRPLNSNDNWKEFSKYTPYAHSKASSFFSAIKFQEHSKVEEMLKADRSLVQVVDFVGESPLHWTVKRKDKKMARLLIRFGARVDQQDVAMRTPLYLAVKHDDYSMSKMLLQNGASPFVRSLSNLNPKKIAREGIGILMKRYGK